MRDTTGTIVLTYQGQDRGAACRADTVYRTEESAKYYGAQS